MGRPSWTDDRGFDTVAGRRERSDDIDGRLAHWFSGRDLRCTVEELAGAGIPAAPVVSPSLVTEDPQLIDRGFFETLEHPRTGPGRYPRPPFASIDEQRTWLMRPPPALGEHNGEVLRDRCGLTDQDLARLASAGVIGTRPKGL
jgi:crotonobetainyl-CoA:carnitine CoA-transferase CaiB-like acyl-CoA transferase